MTTALSPSRARAGVAVDADLVASLSKTLEIEGVVKLPSLVADTMLRDMQAAFTSRLKCQRWNDCEGYERTERLRLMVPDVLTLSQGFVDVALHPLVTGVLNEYLGSSWSLCEAKGWKSLPTQRDFHGWHGDSWYDQTKITDRIPREVKLAFYLSDVTSGAFQYIRRTHGQKAPYHLKREDIGQLPMEQKAEFLGSAGTAVLFDTSGIHRQSVPILEPRLAVFYNYHDPSIPLQAEDVAYYRYHPLLLNAAFLGDLTAEDQRILGFGDQRHYQPHFVRRTSHPLFQSSLTAAFNFKLQWTEWSGRLFSKLKRLVLRR